MSYQLIIFVFLEDDVTLDNPAVICLADIIQFFICNHIQTNTLANCIPNATVNYPTHTHTHIHKHTPPTPHIHLFWGPAPGGPGSWVWVCAPAGGSVCWGWRPVSWALEGGLEEDSPSAPTPQPHTADTHYAGMAGGWAASPSRHTLGNAAPAPYSSCWTGGEERR